MTPRPPSRAPQPARAHPTHPRDRARRSPSGQPPLTSPASPPGARPDDGDDLVLVGRHEVLAALDSPTPPELVFLAASAHGPGIEAIRQAASRRQVKLQVLAPDLFRRRFGEQAQGVAARAGAYAYADFEAIRRGLPATGPVILLALHQVEDPRNLGAIVRTAEAAGVAAVLIPKHRAAGMTAGALRTAQGAAAWLPVARVTNLAQTLATLKQHGFWVYGLDAAGAERYDRVTYPERVVLVAGGEDAGLGRVVAGLCDQTVAIPLAGRTPSLNVGISTAIVLFEILRQREFSPASAKISLPSS
ncbi:MAG: 23S rRNA (guanosine-2'-O-) -methyltransferase rlmB [Candidatus Ozemobacter sibiricus]|uniref:23S rRNA (Guanosine-2'-O-)-methyltransferase rlmB n=1 Tax=Candidatus Ozemobacter sibiricus TaxID=2268124 RepID=A0A367ZNP0_9BACT|nr:MAG: 23S rRNA (guanosine-2'-O-) -methyltransferase rlmB [Candidatus Ozemobacter sibiricus]